MSIAPPGPGCWERDTAHFPRPVTPLCAEMFSEHFAAGFREGVRECATLLDHVEWRPVNGFMYMAPRVVGAGRGVPTLPPKLIFKMIIRAHPEMRRRIRRAATIFTERPWRAALDEWDTRLKPDSIRSHLALLREDPASLDAEALLAYLDRCRSQLARMLHQRGRLTVPCLLPVGDFLAHVMGWTGLPAAALLRLLRGASPVSAGASAELQRLLTAIRRDPDAAHDLDAPPREAIRRLREHGGEVGTAAAGYFDLVGHRVVAGYDVCDPCALEMPEMLVESIRTALLRRGDSSVSDDLGAVRARVPAAERARFDELLAEARHIYRLRDERGLFSDLWANGLLRRALLVAGARLAAAGRLDAPEHLLDASYDEIRRLVATGEGPTANELSARATTRTDRHRAEVPGALGRAMPAPPPPGWLPPAAERVSRALRAAVDAIAHESASGADPAVLYGLGASRGTYQGPARVVLSPAELHRVQRGDVLVTTATSPSFNLVIPSLGALVTDFGGTLSHAAIVAREFGIPAVVGTREATRWIVDGERVCVDGAAGEVRRVP